MVTQDDTAPMEDRDEAASQIISKAQDGDPFAQYLTGRLYVNGPVLEGVFKLKQSKREWQQAG